VEKEPSNQKPGVLDYTALKNSKTGIMKINYLTENTPLPQNKDETTDVLLVISQLCSVQYIQLFIFSPYTTQINIQGTQFRTFYGPTPDLYI